MNEDRFLCFKELSHKALLWGDGFFSLREQELNPYGYLFAVADGVGGQNAGEVASNQAIQHLWKIYYTGFGGSSLDTLDRFRKVFQHVHEELRTLSRSKFEYRGMGTTLMAAVLKERTLFWAHVGDSRLYKINLLDGIKRLTRDHTLTARGLQEGLLDPEDLSGSQKGDLYQAMGASPQIQVDVGQQKLSPHEWILLCSDGLTDVVEEGTVEKLVQKAGSPRGACEVLAKAVNERGREDDLTIIVIRTMND